MQTYYNFTEQYPKCYDNQAWEKRVYPAGVIAHKTLRSWLRYSRRVLGESFRQQKKNRYK